jgi:hypothetical protein
MPTFPHSSARSTRGMIAAWLRAGAIDQGVKAAWTVLVAKSGKGDSQAIRTHVAQTLSGFGCLPSQVIDRLTHTPINP